MPIENISDTARWVAVYRAMETARPDAIFRDPFAERLAGERGHQIIDEMPRGRTDAWPMIVRTAIFDELILDAVRNRQVNLVVNLAAGLDARPWRLPLPPDLRWVDVDLPGILDYKTEALRQEKPVCRYEAVTADLKNRQVRRELFARIGTGSARAIVVTEGLLVYLPREEVASLATDLHAQPGFKYWVTDLASPQLLQRVQRTWGKKLKESGSPLVFGPEEGTEFFHPCGWREAEYRSVWEEAQRLNRTMKGAWLWNLIGRLAPKKTREGFRRFSGIVLLEKV
jgi:methyltransferase (TIGR00027 family)